MVTTAMTIAFGATPFRVIGEDELLKFTVTSGELVIRRLLRGFRLLYTIAVNGNRISLTIVIHIEPLSEINRPLYSPIPEEWDPSSLHPPLFVKNDENTFLPGYPFQLHCPLCPQLLETGETCFHPDRGIKIFRRSPEDASSGDYILDRPFKVLACHIWRHSTRKRSLQSSCILVSSSRTDLLSSSSFSSGITFNSYSNRRDNKNCIGPRNSSSISYPIIRLSSYPSYPPNFPEPSSIPTRQFCQHQGNGRGDNRNTRVINQPWR